MNTSHLSQAEPGSIPGSLVQQLQQLPTLIDTFSLTLTLQWKSRSFRTNEINQQQSEAGKTIITIPKEPII